MADALPDYRQAYQYCPDNLRYAREYAGAAFGERQYADAEKGWTAALQLSRDLAARDPGAYLPDRAATLDNFGNLYHHTGRPAEAEKVFSEAPNDLTIYRDLASNNPKVYAGEVELLTNRLAAVSASP
jgi:tetratricopeptide (TPR) repeat protein